MQDNILPEGLKCTQERGSDPKGMIFLSCMIWLMMDYFFPKLNENHTMFEVSPIQGLATAVIHNYVCTSLKLLLQHLLKTKKVMVPFTRLKISISGYMAKPFLPHSVLRTNATDFIRISINSQLITDQYCGRSIFHFFRKQFIRYHSFNNSKSSYFKPIYKKVIMC